MAKSSTTYPLKVKRALPKPANPKLLAAPVPYRAAKSKRVLGGMSK